MQVRLYAIPSDAFESSEAGSESSEAEGEVAAGEREGPAEEADEHEAPVRPEGTAAAAAAVPVEKDTSAS